MIQRIKRMRTAKMTTDSVNCVYGDRRVLSESYGVGVGNNSDVNMPIRERCWEGCTFRKWFTKEGFFYFNVITADEHFAICECTNRERAGEVWVFDLDEECKSPRYLPNPEELIRRRNEIRDLWTEEEEKIRRVEGPGENGCILLCHDQSRAQRRKWKSD